MSADLLDRDGSVIDHAAAERKHHAGDDEERGPDETVKDHEADQRVDREIAAGKPNTNVRYRSNRSGTVRNSSIPRPSGNVMAAARTQPHMISQCARRAARRGGR